MESKPDAAKVRQVLEAEPALNALADTLRARFGARLIALRCGDVSIGWDKWRAISDSAEPATLGFDFKAAREEWKRIKAASVEARDATRRGATPGKRRVVRGGA